MAWQVNGKVIVLIARAACASVSHGFSSYSESMMRRSTGKLHNSQKLLMWLLPQTICPLSFERGRRQPWGAEELKATGDFMSELDLKRQYPSHCKSMFILPRTIRIDNRVPECIFTNLSHNNTGAQFSKTHIYTSGNHFCPHYFSKIRNALGHTYTRTH